MDRREGVATASFTELQEGGPRQSERSDAGNDLRRAEKLEGKDTQNSTLLVASVPLQATTFLTKHQQQNPSLLQQSEGGRERESTRERVGWNSTDTVLSNHPRSSLPLWGLIVTPIRNAAL